MLADTLRVHPEVWAIMAGSAPKRRRKPLPLQPEAAPLATCSSMVVGCRMVLRMKRCVSAAVKAARGASI